MKEFVEKINPNLSYDELYQLAQRVMNDRVRSFYTPVYFASLDRVYTISKEEIENVIFNITFSINVRAAFAQMLLENNWYIYGKDVYMPTEEPLYFKSKKALKRYAYGCISDKNYFSKYVTGKRDFWGAFKKRIVH